MSNETISHEVTNVTPEQARDWLRDTRNKAKPDPRLLESYKRDMAAGAWKLNGDPLIFGIDGSLLDGRLRLMAAVEAGITFQTVIVRGIDPNHFFTIDALRRRTASDIMHIRGEPSGRALAAALGFLWRAALGDIAKQSKRVSLPELVELLEKNESVRRSIDVAKAAAPALPHGLGAGLHYLFQNEDRHLADRFFSEFSSNIENPNGVVFALKRALANMLEEGGRRSPTVTVALAFKAWAGYKENRPIRLLRFVTDTEEFPDTPGLDGLELPRTAVEGRSLSVVVPGRADELPSLSEIEVILQEITPIQAAEILSRNDKNRQIATGIVSKYVRDMEEGRWALNGQTIKIGKTGRLLDGQHRLTASVKSNKPFVGIIVRGLDEAVFDTFDVGNKRSFADILSDMGEINTALLAGAIRQVWQLENGFVQARTVSPSVNELLDTLERHPEIRASVNYGNNFRKLGSPSQLAALHYCFRRADRQNADEFIERLVHGDNLERGSPVLALRDTLIEDRNNPKRRIGVAERVAITIKAWNHFLAGTDVKWLRFTPAREAFPDISGNPFAEVSYDAAA
jgi:hypothetical protein